MQESVLAVYRADAVREQPRNDLQEMGATSWSVGATRNILTDLLDEFARITLFTGVYIVEAKLPIEDKIVLGEQLYDDANAVAQILQRSTELGLDQAVALASIRRTFCGKSLNATSDLPALCRSKQRALDDLQLALAAIRPVSDSPTYVTIENISRKLQAHVARLADRVAVAHRNEDTAALPLLCGRVSERIPYRDDRFTVVEAVSRPRSFGRFSDKTIEGLHQGLMATEIPTIEACAADIVDSPEMAWEFVVDMARQAWDEARHAQAFCDRISELGGKIGQYPIDMRSWLLCADLPLEMRLAAHQRIGEWIGCDVLDLTIAEHIAQGDIKTARVYEFIQQDEFTHVAFGNKWLRVLVPSEDKLRSLHEEAEALRLTFGLMAGSTRRAALNVGNCERGGFKTNEIDLLNGVPHTPSRESSK